MRRPSAKDGDAENRHLRRELEKYSAKLASEKNRAAMLELQLKSMRATMTPALGDSPTDDDSLAEANAKLKAENKALKTELEDARSHIFGLQSYRKDLTPEEVKRVGGTSSCPGVVCC